MWGVENLWIIETTLLEPRSRKKIKMEPQKGVDGWNEIIDVHECHLHPSRFDSITPAYFYFNLFMRWLKHISHSRRTWRVSRRSKNLRIYFMNQTHDEIKCNICNSFYGFSTLRKMLGEPIFHGIFVLQINTLYKSQRNYIYSMHIVRRKVGPIMAHNFGQILIILI